MDNERRPCNNIAACEHVRLAGLVRQLIDLNAAFFIKLHSAFFNAAPVDDLTDRSDNVINVYSLKFARRHRRTPAGGVRSAELHLFKLQRRDGSVFSDYLNRGGEKVQLHAFVQSVLNLIGIGFELVSSASVNKSDFLCAQPYRTARNVNRNVAAADHGNTLAELNVLAGKR